MPARRALDIADRVVRQAYDSAVSTHEDFRKRISAERVRFGEAVKNSAARPG